MSLRECLAAEGMAATGPAAQVIYSGGVDVDTRAGTGRRCVKIFVSILLVCVLGVPHEHTNSKRA
jgi:hypothetical protein